MNEFNWLDVTSFIVNEGKTFVFIFAVFAVILIMITIPLSGEGLLKTRNAVIVSLAGGLMLLLLGLTSFIPTHEKILQVKIEKIKNEAVSKENIDKGIGHIERVLKKLEVKYLGEEK